MGEPSPGCPVRHHLERGSGCSGERRARGAGWGQERSDARGRIANILWRLEKGELDGVNPRVIVVLTGTNDVAALPRTDESVESISGGIQAIVRVCRTKAPNAPIILTAIFPRHDDLHLVPTIRKVNQRIARLADSRRVWFLDVNDRLADQEGRLFDGMMNAGDKLHPTVRGYQVWADGLKLLLTEGEYNMQQGGCG